MSSEAPPQTIEHGRYALRFARHSVGLPASPPPRAKHRAAGGTPSDRSLAELAIDGCYVGGGLTHVVCLELLRHLEGLGCLRRCQARGHRSSNPLEEHAGEFSVVLEIAPGHQVAGLAPGRNGSRIVAGAHAA